MAFSKDGTRAAAVEYDGGSRPAIGIYELDGGTLITSINPFQDGGGPDAWVSALTFSPDGKTLAVGALQSSLQDTPRLSVQLWDLERKEIKRRLRAAIAPPGNLCFSPDGTLLATSAARGSPLQIWRVSDGNEVRSFKVEADAHGRDPAPIAFSPSSKQFAAADANRDIYVWELATGSKVRTFQGHRKAVTSLAFSPDGKTLLSGSEDATLLLWDVSGTGKPKISLTPKLLTDYWDALADKDPNLAAEAAAALLNAPQQTVEVLDKKLTAGDALDVDELPQLIADLSGEDGKANLLAAVRLKSFGSKASPALFKALAEKPSLAARLRLEEVLQTIGEYPIPSEALQRTRAIQLLEQIGSEQAASVLMRLAEAAPPTPASLDAGAALERLQQRPGAPKLKPTGSSKE
jgi:hypothetical protein